MVTSTKYLSWLNINVALSNSVNNYINNVYGLMGNNNGDPTDDIVSRNGTKSSGNSEANIYYTLVTCKILFTLFKHFVLRY